MHLGHFRSCSLPCVSRNPGLLQLYRTWEFLLHGLDKYAERAAGRLQTATHIDFAREVKVSIKCYFLPLQCVWASPETFDRSLSSFPEVESLKAEQRLVMEKVVHGRDVFAQFNTDGIREELDISDLAPSVQMSQIYGPQFSFKPLTCDRFSDLTSHGRPGEVAEATGFCSCIYWRKQLQRP